MNERISLLNIILLLAHESYNENKNPTTLGLIKDTLSTINPNEISSGVTDDENIIVALKELALWMVKEGTTSPYEIDAIKSQLRMILIGHPEFTENLLEDLAAIANLTKEEVENKVGFYYKRVRSFYNEVAFQKIFSRYYFEVRNTIDGATDKEEFLNKMIEEAKPFIGSNRSGLAGIGAIQSTLNLSDKERFKEVFEKARHAVSTTGMLHTGLQGWNEALGGGIPRGCVINLDAMTGRGKSDTIRYMMRTIAKFTVPFKFFPDRKKNMLLYISCEDTDTDVVRKMYCDIMEEETGTNCELEKVDVEEAQRVVDDYFMENGYHFQIVYARKHELKVRDIHEIVNHYEKEGYEIFMMALDYLQLLYYQDMPGGNDPTKVKNLIGSIETHTKPRMISFITANQLDSEAKKIARFEREIAPALVGKNHQENCKSITNEVDIEITTHIVTAAESGDGYSYHQFAVGKNRISKKVPALSKYAVYRMCVDVDYKPIGFITPDFGKASQVRNETGGALRSQGGGFGF